MPFKDPEAKKAYNKAYYEKNKLKLNVERIVKDIKNNDQRCVRPSTLLKYDEAINDNQLTFLTDLVQKCKDERKVLFELPKPQPIIEAPVIIAAIPFIQKLPITKTFKKNTDQNTFTIDEARTVIHESRKKNGGGTEITYMNQINSMMTKFGLNNETGLWSDIYKKGFKEIIRVLTKM